MGKNVVVHTVVNTSDSERGFKEFSDQAERASKKAKDSVGGVQAPLTQTGTTAQSMGQKFAGAGAAISGASASLQLMGRQGPPALQTVASAAAALAISGTGPMALAIAGVTALVGIVATLGDESEGAASGMELLEGALEKGRDRAEELRLELVRLKDEITAARTGRSVGAVGRGRDLDALRSERDEINQALDLVSGLQAARRTGGVPSGPAGRRIVGGLQGELGGLRERSRFDVIRGLEFGGFQNMDSQLEEMEESLRERLGIISKQARRMMEAEVDEGVLAGLKGPPSGMSTTTALGFAQRLGARPRLFSTSDPRAPEFFGELDPEAAAAAAAARYGIRSPSELRAATGSAAAASALMDAEEAAYQARVREFESFGRIGGTSAMGEQIRLTGRGNGNLMAGILGEHTGFDLSAEAAISPGAQAKADAFASTIATSLDQALATRDFSAAGEAIGRQIASSFVTSLAEAALEGFGVKKALAEGFESIGGAFS